MKIKRKKRIPKNQLASYFKKSYLSKTGHSISVQSLKKAQVPEVTR